MNSVMKEEIWVELFTKHDDLFFYMVQDPTKMIWYEQAVNSNRFKNVDGNVYYHLNGKDMKTVADRLENLSVIKKEDYKRWDNRIQEPVTQIRKLISDLQALQSDKDYERAHGLADELLLAYINDKEVTEAFNKITKHYA